MNVQSEAAAQLAHFFMMLAGDGHTTWACGVGTWRTSSMCLGIQGSTVTSRGKSKVFWLLSSRPPLTVALSQDDQDHKSLSLRRGLA